MSETCRYSERIHMYKKGKEDHRFLGGKRKPVRMQCVVDIRTVGIKFTRGSLCTRSSVRTATQSGLGGYGYGANVHGPPNAYVEASPHWDSTGGLQEVVRSREWSTFEWDPSPPKRGPTELSRPSHHGRTQREVGPHWNPAMLAPWSRPRKNIF